MYTTALFIFYFSSSLRRLYPCSHQHCSWLAWKWISWIWLELVELLGLSTWVGSTLNLYPIFLSVSELAWQPWVTLGLEVLGPSSIWMYLETFVGMAIAMMMVEVVVELEFSNSVHLPILVSVLALLSSFLALE